MENVQINSGAIHEMFSDPGSPVGQIIEHKTQAVEAVAKASLVHSGGGRTYTPGIYFYRKYGKLYRFEIDHVHEASAPSSPPASDLGQLLASIDHAISVEGTVVGRVTAHKFYAIYLELGTRLMAPRPFLRPALEIGVQE